MSELFCINFTYRSPHEDTETVMGFNSDGTVNVKYTLMALRDMLVHNTNIINKLIEKHDIITDIVPIGYGYVGVSTNYPSIAQTLVELNVLAKKIDDLENEEAGIDEFNFSDDEETNQERLNSVNNLINQNDTNCIFNNNDSETNSKSESDDIIDDEHNTNSILSKYINIIGERESDNSNDSNKSESTDDSYSDEEEADNN